LGAEIVIQAFRQPPRGLRFDPMVVLLTGLMLLLASNTRGEHLFLLAPIVVFCTLMALRDLRATGKMTPGARIRGMALLGVACALGAFSHSQLWEKRAEITALGARLLSNQQIAAQQGNPVTDTPELGPAFASGASTARLLRIKGKLSDSHLRTAAFPTYQNGSWGPSLVSRKADANALPEQTRESLPLIKGNFATFKHRIPHRYRRDYHGSATNEQRYFRAAQHLGARARPAGHRRFVLWDRFQGPVKVEADTPTPFSYGIVEARDDINGIQTTQGPLAVPLYGFAIESGEFTTIVTPQQRAELLNVPCGNRPARA
jgi:hypothetical protein